MTAAKKYLPHYTVTDYRRWEGDWELWNGIPIAMRPCPFGKHQTALTRLSRLIGNALEAANCRAETLVELDWIVTDDTVVRPDVMVVCGEPPDGHLEATPAFVAEVLSDSTRLRDRTYKRDLYDEQGVAVYLLVDPDAETVEILRRDEAGNWRIQTVESEISFTICDECEIRLQSAALFSR